MFLIVEIVNDTGEKEWKIAPKRWVCTSKNTQRPILFWPDEFSIERQNLLAIEGTCKPLQCWMRKECVIRQEFPSYETANTELQTLLKQHSDQIKEEPEDPLNVEDRAVKTPEPACATVPDEDASTLASIKSMLQSLISKNAQIEQQNVDVVQQNYRIESIIFNLQKRIKAVESKFTSSLFSVDNSCNTPEETIRQQSSEGKFSFEPTKTVWQLQELEKKLNDESFTAELVQFLRANVCGDNTTLRITNCMNLLCSLELQSKIKWVWLVKLQNFLNLLKEVGETSAERVTFSALANFFEKLSRRILVMKMQRYHLEEKIVFKPRETVEELRELEEKLNGESFNRELLRWLFLNVKDDNSVWRMKSCLDLLCTIELQSKLKWSGRMRSVMKEPLETLPNFVKLFEVVGKTPSEDVTHKEVRQCLSIHLKNSGQRYRLSLNRRRVSKWKRSGKREKSNAVVSEQGNSSIATNENSRTEIERD